MMRFVGVLFLGTAALVGFERILLPVLGVRSVVEPEFAVQSIRTSVEEALLAYKETKKRPSNPTEVQV